MRPAVRLTRTDTPLLAGVAKRPAARSILVFRHASGKENTFRGLHTSTLRERPASAHHADSSANRGAGDRGAKVESATASTTSMLPLSQVLRTYFIASISSSPLLLGASTSLLQRMLNSRNPLFRIDTNPVLRGLLWHTFYKQFCTGETEAQVKKGCQDLRDHGYSGVILEYALELLKGAEGDEAHDVAKWRKALLNSVKLTEPGDFIGLKWSGMGADAMRRMAQGEQPTKRMTEAMHALCEAARDKDVSLLPAAEETWSLKGFNSWTMAMQRAYNLNGRSAVYNTYQAYLKQTPENLARHLEEARQGGFTLGIKLVREAYLSSDDRSKIHATIEDTHNAYDGIASALIHRKYNSVLVSSSGETGGNLPPISVVLATHNAASVQQAQTLRRQQVARGEELTDMAFAQLQGMADEVSCSLVALGKSECSKEKVYKCTTWGPMHECLNYLLRKASENKDAAGRTADTRKAMKAEIWRRARRAFLKSSMER